MTTRFSLLALAAALAALPAAGQVAAPVLKWQHGGCHPSWCETGWYASPAVADLDGDGAPEVVAAASSVVALWRAADGGERSSRLTGSQLTRAIAEGWMRFLPSSLAL